MSYKVFTAADLSQLDSLPVAKITDYPLEPRDYKPYAQSNLCLCAGELVLRMWAFEVSPSPRSMLRCVLYLFGGGERALCVDFTADETLTLRYLHRGQPDASPLSLPAGACWSPHSGEDLQGVYWGALIRLPLAWLESLGAVPLEKGAAFDGNFYKLCADEESAHQGCFFPADFPGNPYAYESMGRFEPQIRQPNAAK